ncbi:hypothetical protein [Streptomyces olivaceoviridis]|uniref:hypothetical protein n=1 Tax=Streptomyces olivaceoviridis TaxID=1921 RepID=UPI0036A21369
MATDTVPAAVPGPPEPPDTAASDTTPGRGFLASMVAAVEPARPTFQITPTTGSASTDSDPDGTLDRSAPGISSASFRNTAEQASRNSDPAGTKAKRSVWKEMLLAAATRWAKGGGTANKRLDLAKAQAQARAHQVKENRTTTVMNSGGIPVRNSSGAGGGSKDSRGKSGSDIRGKGPVNGGGSSGSSGGGGRGGSGGGRGPAGGAGHHGSTGGGGSNGGRGTGNGGTGGGGNSRQPQHSGGTGKQPKDKHAKDHGQNSPKTPNSANTGGSGAGSGKPASGTGSKGTGSAGSGGGAGKHGASGKDGSSGRNGTPGTSGTSGGSATAGGTGGKHGPGKHNSSGKGSDTNKNQPGKNDKKSKHPNVGADPRSPLQKSRETGHKDGSAVRNIVDHVVAYTDGVRDGYHDKKHQNAKEHARLDKAHTDHQAKTRATQQADDTTKTGTQPVIVTDKEDDGVSTDVKPLTVTTIDANTLTLGAGNLRDTVSRRELRNFKQYERKLEVKATNLQRIADVTKQLQSEAEEEAKDCQKLTEQAKSIAGGEKLVATLAKLTDAATAQATEAGELHVRARRAAEMCQVVLTNIQTRYAPLYKAVVDSDETKPAELRFYTDKGSYAPAA